MQLIRCDWFCHITPILLVTLFLWICLLVITYIVDMPWLCRPLQLKDNNPEGLLSFVLIWLLLALDSLLELGCIFYLVSTVPMIPIVFKGGGVVREYVCSCADICGDIAM